MTDPAFDAWFAQARAAPLQEICARRGIKLKREGKWHVGPCPKCGTGENRFFINVNEQLFGCRKCNAGGHGAIDLVCWLDEIEPAPAAEQLNGPPPKANGNGKDHAPEPREVTRARFVYHDESGNTLFEVGRIEFQNPDGSFVLKDGKRAKKFRQKRPDPDRPGEWIYNVKGVRVVPYRLPELIEAIGNGYTVLIVEGEAKVDLLRKWGLVATCNAGGAEKWRAEHAEFFRGADVVIAPDNDEPGHKHRDIVGTSLQGIAATVHVLELPGLPPKGDIKDWAKIGGTREKLDELLRQAKPWAPRNGAESEPQPDTAESAEAKSNGQEAPEDDLLAAFTFIGDAPAAPPQELIKGLLPAYGVAVTGGQSTAGKTFIQIHKSICLATTQPYFGHKIIERVGTVFVAAEGCALIPNRFAAGLINAAMADKLPIAWIKKVPDFSTKDGIKLFIRQLKAIDERFQGDFGARLGNVPLDTVAACFAMKDEDDNAEATKVCNVLRTIGDETGALMAPVHHYGKNPESGLRGASAWKGSADIVEGVLADIDPMSGRTSNRELVCTKARDGEQGPISPFELKFIKLGEHADGDEYGSLCVIPSDGESRFDRATKSTKGQRAIHDAINEMMDGMSKIITPRPGMPSVAAVKVVDLRKEFDRRYVVDEADPLLAADAKRKAFKRALDQLSSTQFGAGNAEDADWIWKITS